jgi:predicted 3-demethylubiquinone-9 3-methyltransferase (glyoxalase superfamily)
MQKISPFLWFDDEAEEAAKFYTSIFKNSKIGNISYYRKGGPRAAGTVMTVEFQLEGQDFIALNGGPMIKFSEAVSLSVDCSSQEEIDYFWQKLSAEGGQTGPCGWLKDKFGLSWQVNPRILAEMLQDTDAAKAERVMRAMMEMEKIDIAELNEAYGKSV